MWLNQECAVKDTPRTDHSQSGPTSSVGRTAACCRSPGVSSDGLYKSVTSINLSFFKDLLLQSSTGHQANLETSVGDHQLNLENCSTQSLSPHCKSDGFMRWWCSSVCLFTHLLLPTKEEVHVFTHVCLSVCLSVWASHGFKMVLCTDCWKTFVGAVHALYRVPF